LSIPSRLVQPRLGRDNPTEGAFHRNRGWAMRRTAGHQPRPLATGNRQAPSPACALFQSCRAPPARSTYPRRMPIRKPGGPLQPIRGRAARRRYPDSRAPPRVGVPSSRATCWPQSLPSSPDSGVVTWTGARRQTAEPNRAARGGLRTPRKTAVNWLAPASESSPVSHTRARQIHGEHRAQRPCNRSPQWPIPSS
jgi:hypothetical protein